jgi:uncharacterized phage protein gp47/JayE
LPANNGSFEKYTEEEIYNRLESNLESELGASAEPGNLVRHQLAAEARTLANLYEEALENVYEAAYLEDAEDRELEKLVDLIGLSRREASPATGTVRFSREKPPTTTYPIPSGIKIQTESIDPIEFKTTKSSSLEYIDGFEDGNLTGWVGDTGSVSTVNTSNMSGDKALSLPATSGIEVTTDSDYEIGTIFEMDIRPEGDSITGVQFGKEDGSNYFEVVLDAGNNNFKIAEIVNGAEDRSNTNNTGITVNETVHLTIEWSLYGDHRATLYEDESKTTEIDSVFLEDIGDVNRNTGSLGLVSKDNTATTLVDEIAVSAVVVNIEAVGSGIDTNVSAGSIRTFPESISGVQEVINQVPTGNDKYRNTDLLTLSIGKEREDDEELRQRAFDNTAIGGAATAKAIDTKLSELDEVDSLTINRNRENTSVDGMPAHSFEAVIYGGTDKEIGETIFNTASIDSNDVGGINGTAKSYTIESEITGDTEIINWSSPIKYDLNITLDLIVDDSYVGDDEISHLIADYIGGTDIDGTELTGLSVGEDLYESILKKKIVGPSETGVWEVDSLTVDSNNDGTDDTTTKTTGADVLSVNKNEVVEINAQDGSITVNNTLK